MLKDLEKRIIEMLEDDTCNFRAQCVAQEYVTETGCKIYHPTCPLFKEYINRYIQSQMDNYIRRITKNGEK